MKDWANLEMETGECIKGKRNDQEVVFKNPDVNILIFKFPSCFKHEDIMI